MVDYPKQPDRDGLIKLSGRIRNYRQTREEASFVLTGNDRRTMGMVSIALASAGMGGQAIGTAANASHIEEEADHVAFDLDGKLMEGWLWRSPFQEGDSVEVVAVAQGEHYEFLAVAKPSERLIALYPQCVRGRGAFFRLAAKWWMILFFLFSPLLMGILVWLGEGIGKVFSSDFAILWSIGGVICTFILAMLVRQWTPFVRTAQRIFIVFGWENASSLDLVKTTRQQRNPGDPPELGVYYFKY